MRLLPLLSAAAFALPLLSSHAVPARADSPIRLNEILAGPARDWDGSGAFSSRDDEWVEIVNASDLPLNINGYLITDGDSIPRYPLSGSLAPHARVLVTGKMSYDWERANAQPAFGLSLGNSGDAVILWRVIGADTVEVDRYTYKSHEAAADRAIGRSLDGSGGWVLFDNLNPYTGSLLPGGTGCTPSPGAPNTCSVTPAQRTTWGMIKAAYR